MILHTLHAYRWVHYFLAIKFTKQVKLLLVYFIFDRNLESLLHAYIIILYVLILQEAQKMCQM